MGPDIGGTPAPGESCSSSSSSSSSISRSRRLWKWEIDDEDEDDDEDDKTRVPDLPANRGHTQDYGRSGGGRPRVLYYGLAGEASGTPAQAGRR